MKFGLRVRYTLDIVGLVLAISAILSGTLLYITNASHREVTETASKVVSESLQKQTQQRGEKIVSFLGEALVNPLYFHDLQTVYELLQVTGKQWGVEYILVYDDLGKIVHDGVETIPSSGHLLESEQALSVLRNTFKPTSWQDASSIKFSAPILLGDNPIGGVTVAISTSMLQQSILDMNDGMNQVHHTGIRKTIGIMLWITLLMSVIGVGISLLIGKRIVKPIRRLVNQTYEIGRGNFNHHAILSNRSDEIGELMRAFNDMGDQLGVTQEQLLTAKENAEAASTAKSQFLASISHEIRTPMNGVIGSLDLLQDAALNEEHKSYLVAAIASAEIQLALINDILDFSKIEANQVELECSPINVRELLGDIQLLFEVPAKEKGLHLVFSLDPNIPNRVAGDSVRLRQILMNLVGNAIKFTSKGQVKVTVDVHTRQDHQVTLNFSVEDTGIGVALERRDSIFDAFVQADSSTSRLFGGTGLGLTIANELTALMGGQLELESEVGRGTKFFFTIGFELLRQSLEAKSPNAIAALKAANHLDITSTAKVLLAEDNAVNQKITRAMLMQFGCEVVVVDDGLAVLDAIKQDEYHMILLDCDMPKMDGFEAARIIREMEKNRKDSDQAVPIIALTAHAASEAKEQCLAAGMSDFLSKPFNRQQLAEVFRRWQ